MIRSSGLWSAYGTRPPDLAISDLPRCRRVLCESAAALVELLKPSASYTEVELRKSAALRMRNNEEFQDTVAHVPGLFDKLVRIVDVPEEF